LNSIEEGVGDDGYAVVDVVNLEGHVD